MEQEVKERLKVSALGLEELTEIKRGILCK